MKTQFQTQYSRHEVPGEKNNLPSRTVPDQTMSLRELIRRYTQGLPINGAKVPLYDDDPENNDLPDPKKLDLAEREELALQYADELAALREKHKLQYEKVQAARDAAVKASQNASNENPDAK